MRPIYALLKNQETLWSLKPQDSVFDALKTLADHNVGALMVMDQGKLVGILSERDIVRAVAQDGSAGLGRTISGIMSRDVIFAEPNETIDALLERMTDRRIRHLPVLRNDRLIGIISIGDLVKSKIAEAEAEAQHLKAYIAAG